MPFLACSRSPCGVAIVAHWDAACVANHRSCWSQQVLSGVVEQSLVKLESATTHDSLAVLRSQLVLRLGASLVRHLEDVVRAGCSLLGEHSRVVAVLTTAIPHIDVTHCVLWVLRCVHVCLQILGEVHLVR